MGALLTSLGSVLNQAGTATTEARKERQARADKILQQGLEQRRVGAEESYLQLARSADERARQEFEYRKKSGDLIEFKDGRIWSVSQGKFIDPQRPDPMDTMKRYIAGRPKAIQSKLTDVAHSYLELDPNNPRHAIDKVLSMAEDYDKQQEREQAAARKVDPVISAQIGPRPEPSAYPQGESDPAYKLASKKWGIAAETVKTRMAAAGAEARGKAYGMYRPGAYITPDGQVVTAYAGDAISRGLTPFAPGFQSMSRTQQISEMKGASTNLRSAITALQPDDAFDATSVVQLRMAAAGGDPSAFRAVLDNLAASATNERQQNYLIWLGQMGERVLSLRNVAGMGQGAQDLRAAIQATLPGISSGSKEFALRKLDAVDNQIDILGRGIPHTNVNTTGQPRVRIGKDGSITVE